MIYVLIILLIIGGGWLWNEYRNAPLEEEEKEGE
mgnify:CR=1 FL=1